MRCTLSAPKRLPRLAAPVLGSALALLLGLGTLTPARAAARFCVYDFLGTAGDIYGVAKDYALAMQRQDVDFTLKAYTDEAAAAEAFKAGQCDALMATAMRTRPFNAAAASIDSLGATTIVRNGHVDLPATYEVTRRLIQTYAAPSPLVQQFMNQGPYEVGGIMPVGAAYLMVKDRRLNNVEALAGKRIAAFTYDRAQAVMIQRIKATPVPADIDSVASKFINGQVDVIALPTMAFQPLELEKGIGPQGGVTRFPLMIVTCQMILQRDRFPEGFGAKSRAYWMTQFDRMMQVIRRGDASVPPLSWIDISPQDAVKYTQLLRESRIQITQMGLYDKRGLKVIKRVRCHINPADAECATKQEEE